MIRESSRLISAVILGGGEPMLQPLVIQELSHYSHSLGLKVGIETSGYNSLALKDLISGGYLDAVFVDLKTWGEDNYFNLTGSKTSWHDVMDSIICCIFTGIELEVRTTIFKDYPDSDSLKRIEHFVENCNLTWKKQEGVLRD